VKKVGIYQARTKFAELASEAENGETILVTRNGKPVAELRPVSSQAALGKVVASILRLNWRLGKSIVETIREAREERA
jgi:prevent-host-death family protein